MRLSVLLGSRVAQITEYIMVMLLLQADFAVDVSLQSQLMITETRLFMSLTVSSCHLHSNRLC